MQNNYFSVEEEKMISEEECFETDNEKTIEGDNGEPSVAENVVKSDVFDVIKKHFDKFWLYYALPVIICCFLPCLKRAIFTRFRTTAFQATTCWRKFARS